MASEPFNFTMPVGLLLCLAWYYTILSGFFVLYCPVIYLMFFNHKWYRKLVDALFAVWELYPVALFQCCYGTKIHHFGDYVNRDEKTIMVMNHRTRLDWNYIWLALYHATQKDSSDETIDTNHFIKEDSNKSQILDIGGKSKLKFVLKDEIKLFPGLGWIMQLNFFLYVKRNWQEDEVAITQFTDYYKKLNYDIRVVLFPEGTDLSEDNKRRSNKFALANNLSSYDFVMHPRTTGWATICSRLRESGLKSIYDVTVAYDNPAQTERDLLSGNLPLNVYFHIKRYSIDKLPKGDIPLKNWLNDRWHEKEISLRKFHKDGNFNDAVTNMIPEYRPPRSMVIAKIGFIFWTIINILFTYAIVNSVVFQFWVIYHSVLFIFVTWSFRGFQNIQYKLSEQNYCLNSYFYGR